MLVTFTAVDNAGAYPGDLKASEMGWTVFWPLDTVSNGYLEVWMDASNCSDAFRKDTARCGDCSERDKRHKTRAGRLCQEVRCPKRSLLLW